MMEFEKITDEQKRECYKSYCENVRYEFGDRVKPMSYEEWCEEAKKFEYLYPNGVTFMCLDNGGHYTTSAITAMR